MAAEAKPQQAQSAGPQKKRGKLLWSVLAALVVIAGAASAWLMLKPSAAAASPGSRSARSAPRTPPIYYKFNAPFLVNFGGAGSARYLQLTLEAMSHNHQILRQLRQNGPAVRNDLLLLFSSQTLADLSSRAGKEALRAAALRDIRKVLDAEGADGKQIRAVYFTSFVIQ